MGNYGINFAVSIAGEVSSIVVLIRVFDVLGAYRYGLLIIHFQLMRKISGFIVISL